MKNMKIILFVAVTMLLFSCNSGNDQTNNENSTSYEDALNQVKSNQGHKGTVVETMDAGGYTYLKLNENGNEYWAAINQRPAQIGQVFYFNNAMEVKDFTSKQLDRTFESILFIQDISEEPIEVVDPVAVLAQQKKTVVERDENISITQPEGAISIEELYKNSSKYEGQMVTVKGVITKLNKMIMNRDWIHIQDGSSSGDSFDLTITTTEINNFQLGETVTFTGTISLNKDFGAGYLYDLIIENATFAY